MFDASEHPSGDFLHLPVSSLQGSTHRWVGMPNGGFSLDSCCSEPSVKGCMAREAGRERSPGMGSVFSFAWRFLGQQSSWATPSTEGLRVEVSKGSCPL